MIFNWPRKKRAGASIRVFKIEIKKLLAPQNNTE